MNRPRPPQSLLDINSVIENGGAGAFIPAPEITEWIQSQIISPQGAIYNARQEHLSMADIGCLWTDAENNRQGKTVLAQAEIFAAKGNPWTVARQEWQLREWFGGAIPNFILTFSAPLLAVCDDRVWCRVVNHECYHCRQQVDDFGMAKFRRSDGKPLWRIVGHDIEVFVAEVEDYGLDAFPPEVSEFVAAANRPPLVSDAQIAGACGTCLKLV